VETPNVSNIDRETSRTPPPFAAVAVRLLVQLRTCYVARLAHAVLHALYR
jgi:hypothetical protein